MTRFCLVSISEVSGRAGGCELTEILWMVFIDQFSVIGIFRLKQKQGWICISMEASPSSVDKA